MSQVCDNYETITKEHGLTIVGISVDDEKRSTRFKKKLGICFDLLSDTSRQVIEEYDVVDQQKRLDGSIALSSDVIINSDGEIIFYHKGTYNERPAVKEVLAAINI